MAEMVVELEEVGLVRGGREILSNVDLAIRQGERWALLGANGAGKSTILSLCGAISHPSRGTVRILGEQLGRVDLRDLRRLIGHVNPRHPLTSALTVFEVVLTGATGSSELVPRWTPEADTLARAEELIESLGLTRLREARWPNLSQGERGRALIARALLPAPPLLLMDEPTTGLDVGSRERFLRTVDELHETHPDLTTVIVTHHLEELPASTTHAVLVSDGRVVSAGPATDVLTSELVSECFDYPVEIGRRHGRWFAHAGGPQLTRRAV